MDIAERFNDSYERVFNQQYDTFFANFYRIFANSAPEVAKLLVNMDMSRQFEMLEESILLIVAYSYGGKTNDGLQRLITVHRRIGVKPEHFDFWLEALVKALKETDSTVNDDDEYAWRYVLTPGLKLLKEQVLKAE